MKQPNLLFLMTDQQRADTVDPVSACRMPHLKSVAEDGTRFARCYAPNPICSPTRASLMTGLLPHNHGMVDCTHTVEPYRAELKAGLPFWSRTLQAAGYRTAYFGKWHIERSQRLEDFGFDVYEANDAPYHEYRRRFNLAQEPRLERRRLVQQKGYADFALCGVTDEPPEAMQEYYLYSRAVEFLQSQRDSSQPWVLFISTPGPHDPYIVPREYYERYNSARMPQPASFGDDLSNRPAIYRRIQGVWRDLSWRDFAEATACYYAFCSLIDDQVGRILGVLRSLGQEDNTLMIYTSDHGDYMGAHRLILKGVPAFEEAYKVPLILKGPGVPASRTISQAVSLLDLPRTIVQLTTGGAFPCEGRSLLPLLSEKVAAWQNEAFAEFHGQRFFYTQRVLWRENLKYIFNGFDEDELYDLDTDPYEMHNLANEAAFRLTAERMAARMWQIIRETGDRNMYQAEYGMFRFAPVGPEEKNQATR